MTRYVTTVLILFVFALGAWAQNSPPQHQHSQVAVTTLDGSAHPELISDSTAYRLYLVTVSEEPNATAEARARQNSHLGMIGLQDGDRQQLVTILADFKSQYLALIDRFNQSATAALAQGMQPDQKTFLQQRDDLVQSTRDAIKRALTADGVARFDAHVQGERKRMKIYTTKEGQ